MSPDDVVRKYLGADYQYQGRGEGGVDCYGLILQIYADAGITLPEIKAPDDARWHMRGERVDIDAISEMFFRVSTERFMDIVAFQNQKGIVHHAGIAMTDGQFIHATRKTGVMVASIHAPMWASRLAGIYRYKGLA